MKRTDVFTCPIWSFEDLPLDNSKLEQHALSLRIKYPDQRNPESWQDVLNYKWKSYDLGGKEFLAIPELNKLVNIVTESVNKCFLEMNPRENVKLELSDVWYNIYDVGSALEGHSHPGNCISATYYIKAPTECGYFICQTPDRTIDYQYSPKFFKNRNEITRTKFVLEPVEGTLICFPSNLYHFVTPNRSKDQRISVAFNYKAVDVNPYPPNHKLFKQ